MLCEIIKVFDGGDGSGHYNHVGIPEHKGGSARSGKFRRNQNKNFSSSHTESKEYDPKSKIKERIKGISEEDTDRYYMSLYYYTGSYYDRIKQAYRDKYSGKQFDEEFEKYSNDLDDFIYRSEKYEGTVYRGLGVSDEDADKIINKLKQGKTMDMQGISSWSSNKSISMNFGKNSLDDNKNICLLFNLENKSGASVKELSVFPEEDEILHPTTSRYVLKNNDFKTTELENGKKIIEINLKEV
ncbi:ADP-ribosyltransferase [Anaerofustis sp.]|uniref:ADP-ribosyltransferase n=1 Tax=Anaerofustis sp. TaxID=1872517 RepID=UPI0025C6CE90|nr:ADP-ribosyltransferase [Anaerofustis sp.]